MTFFIGRLSYSREFFCMKPTLLLLHEENSNNNGSIFDKCRFHREIKIIS